MHNGGIDYMCWVRVRRKGNSDFIFRHYCGSNCPQVVALNSGIDIEKKGDKVFILGKAIGNYCTVLLRAEPLLKDQTLSLT